MKAEERRALERVLAGWRRAIALVDQVGPTSDSPEDLSAFGECKDYVLDRIQAIEDRLERDRLNRRRKSHARREAIALAEAKKNRLSGNGLPVKDNHPHNRLASGGDNG